MPRQPTAVFAKTDRKCSNRTEALHHPTVAAAGGSASGQQRSAAAARRTASHRAGEDIRQTRKEPLGVSEIERSDSAMVSHGLLAVPWSNRRSPEAPTPRGLIGSHRGIYAFRQFGLGGPPLPRPVPSPPAADAGGHIPRARHGLPHRQATRLPSRSRRPCSHGEGRPTGGTALGRTAARV